MIALRLVGASVIIHPTLHLGDRFAEYRRACEGSHYDFASNWNVSALDKVPTILRRLRQAAFEIQAEPEVFAAVERLEAKVWVDSLSTKDRIQTIDTEIRERTEGLKWLYDYQKQGAAWLTQKHSAVLGDDMGLGKTLQGLTALPANTPLLVVGPVVAKGVWAREVTKWRPNLKTTKISGRNHFRWPEPGEMVAINFAILPDPHKPNCRSKSCQGCAEHIAQAPHNAVLIVDEAQEVKNPKTQQSRATKALASAVRARDGRVWLFTGTPLANKPPDLWGVFDVADCAREAFGDWNTFKRLFRGKRVQFGKGRSGYVWGKPEPEVVERLRRVMLRRLKVDVLLDLPEKSYEDIPVEIDKKTLQACGKAMKKAGVLGPEDLAEKLSRKVIPFEEFSAIRAALASAKIPAMLEIVESHEESATPLVVFSAHRAPIDTLESRKGWRVITGDVSSQERSNIEEQFQAGKLLGVGATVGAGGVAITLTRASRALFVDLDPVPGKNDQAADRIYRVGQTRGVMISVLVANHPLDEQIARLLMKKEAVIDASVDAAKAHVEKP